MRTSDMIKSNYISKAEVRAAGGMMLTITGCTLEKVGSDDKYVLWFNEHPKGLTLNNTKIKLLEASYGDDSDYWTGRRVRLTFDPTVQMQGALVGGIKLACSTLQAPPPAAYPAKPIYAAQPGPAGGVGASLQPPPATSAAGAPPAAVWDGARWVIPETGPAPAPQRPLTISQRVNHAHPPADPSWGGVAPPVGSPENEFGDDIPF